MQDVGEPVKPLNHRTSVLLTLSRATTTFILALFGITLFTQSFGVVKSSAASAPTQISDVYPQSSSIGRAPAVLNGSYYFEGNDGTNGWELWKSDGTSAGTSMVADINPGSGSSIPIGIVNVNGTLYFQASDGTHGVELWRSDGTSSGTVMVDDINSGSGDSNPIGITNIGSETYFVANDGTHGRQLWKSDGTAAGTTVVTNFPSSYGFDLTNISGTLFLTLSDGLSGDGQLWKSDGTTAGTVMVTSGLTLPLDAKNYNGTLYFVNYDATDRNGQLWRSDGTASGTVQVTNSVSLSQGHEYLTDVEGTIFFYGYDSSFNYGLWKTDGTAAGTSLVSNVAIDGGADVTGTLSSIGNTVFFSSYDAAHGGDQLWKSDGTAAGTVMVTSGTPYSGISYTISLNDLLYFSGTMNGTSSLWLSDGSAAGTQILMNNARVLDPFGNKLFINANSQLWIYNTLQTPSAPTNLVIPSPTQNPVLSWSSVSGATSYNIYRNNSLIDTITTSITSYTDYLVPEGTSSYYVTAVNSGGESGPSNSVNVLVDRTPSTLGTPTWTNNPMATTQTATATVPASDNLSGVAGGEYYLGTTDPGQGNGTAMTYSSGNITASFSNLTPGIYTVNFRAEDNAGNWSGVVIDYLVVYNPANSSTDGHHNSISPLYGTDVLPGLIQAGQTDKAMAAFSVKLSNGQIDSTSKVHFAYNTGTCHGGNPTNCHNTTLDSASIAWMVINGTNNSQATVQGTATLTIDGVTTTNPFRLIVTDGSLLNPTTNDQFNIQIFAPGADPNTATPLYHLSEPLTRGSIVVKG